MPIALSPPGLPRLNAISVDGTVFVFALAIATLTGLIAGLVPALQAPRVNLRAGSQQNAGSTAGSHSLARRALVVSEVALALVLLVSAGLMIRTFHALRTVEPGFTDAAHLQLMRINIPETLITQPEMVTRTQNAILDKLAAIPGVKSAAFVSAMPMEGFESGWDGIYAEDKNYADTESVPMRFFKYGSPGFLQTAGTRMVAGRDISWDDIYGQRPVVMISENLAREMWGEPAAAIGKRVRKYESQPWHEVVGVVQDVREKGVQEPAPEAVYWPPYAANIFGPSPVGAIRTMTFEIRSDRAGTQALLNEVRLAVWSVNSNLPIASVRTMQEVYEKSLARTSFTLVMLGIAGAMALALGIVGIYGVISYTVAQRQREIGIRLALGAQRGDVLQMILRQGAQMALVGVMIGVAGAFALTRLMTNLLFGVTAHDPITYAAVAALLFVVALLACYIPARRAMRVDPIVALRYE